MGLWGFEALFTTKVPRELPAPPHPPTPASVVGSSYSRFAARLLKPKPRFHHCAQGTAPARLPLVGEGPREGARRDAYGGGQGLLGSQLGLG